MDNEAEWLTEKLKNPAILEKFFNAFNPSSADGSEIKKIQRQIINEFKAPFIERIKKATPETEEQKQLIRYFNKRVKSLPDSDIIDLYADYLRYRAMTTEKGKEIARNHILTSLELSYTLDEWYPKRCNKHK